jgi:hypothetical protein
MPLHGTHPESDSAFVFSQQDDSIYRGMKEITRFFWESTPAAWGRGIWKMFPEPNGPNFCQAKVEEREGGSEVISYGSLSRSFLFGNRFPFFA